MSKKEIDQNVVTVAILATVAVGLLGGFGYSQFRQKQLVDEVVARRELTISREMGVTAEMEGDIRTPQERREARDVVIYERAWKGKSKVEGVDLPDIKPAPAATTVSPAGVTMPEAGTKAPAAAAAPVVAAAPPAASADPKSGVSMP